MSLNNRVFTTPHYHVDFGYDGLRGFDTRLSHTITQHFSYEGYDVELRDTVRGNRRFELWSPNFSTIPMYPGTPPPNFLMTPPLRCLRVDGSGGRYDWTLFPQHLDTNRLHLPFIIRPGQGLRERLVEFRPLTHSPDVWKPTYLGPTKGCISAGYLKSLSERAATLESARIALLPSISAAHPDWAYIKTLVDAHPTPAEISRFTTITDWESFLHGLAHIQRQLREKAAWVHMCEALKHTCWSLGGQLKCWGARQSVRSPTSLHVQIKILSSQQRYNLWLVPDARVSKRRANGSGVEIPLGAHADLARA